MPLQRVIIALACSIITIPLTASDINKISNDLYVGHKGDLHFVFERVSPDNIVFWNTYIQNQTKNIHNILPPEFTSPFSSFKKSLKYYLNDDVWVAYATTEKITKKSADIPLNLTGDIEMAVPIMTNNNIPFYTPMGIIRAIEFIEFKNTNKWTSSSGKLLAPFKAQFSPHKNLSLQLHSFVAQAIKMIYGNKEYLLTRPVKAMSDIFQKNLPEEAVWIGSRKELEEKKRFSQGLKIDETKSPVQDIDQKHKTMTLLSRSGKKISLKMPQFYRKHPHLGKGSLDPIVIIDIDALAGLLKLD
jgi:hypothetical protein